MNEMNINQVKSGQVTFDSSLGQRAALSTPQFREAEELFNATGLPNDILFSAETFREFLVENPGARNLQSYKETFSTAGTNLNESQFSAIFQEFCEDQVALKGHFKPSEASLDWGTYVKERNDTQKHMEIIANDLANATSSQQSSSATSSAKVSKSEKSPLAAMGRLLERMIDLFDIMQEIGMVQAKELVNQTAIEEEYLNQQNILTPFDSGMDLWVKNAKGDKVDKETIAENMKFWNNEILPKHQERVRSLKDQVDARAKQINAKINRTQQMTNNLNDDFNSTLMKFTTSGRAYIR